MKKIRKIINYGKAEVLNAEKEKLSKEPDLRNLFWETTLRCNAKCKHCGSRAGECDTLKDELTTDEIKKAFKEIAEKIEPSKILINVTGGEPLLRKDLFEVMDYAHNELGFRWGITTNGLLINDDIIEKMKQTGLATMSISLDGMENTHDEFRGVKGGFSKTIENIKKLQNDKFLKAFQITTVVNKLNLHELDEMYKLMEDLEVDSWRVINMDPIGRALDNDNLSLDADDYKYIFNLMQEQNKKSKFEITYGCAHYLGMDREYSARNYGFFCFAGFTVASILYNGDIYVCPDVERRKELIQGNVKFDNFADVWFNKFEWFRNLDKLKCEKCANCKEWKYCRGDSLHTWNFDKKEPKLCINNLLKQ
ncbi:MAG: radical SAM protein [Bacilli bacterium]|nr:radical SAM protein [Bacilli bacterium]